MRARLNISSFFAVEVVFLLPALPEGKVEGCHDSQETSSSQMALEAEGRNIRIFKIGFISAAKPNNILKISNDSVSLSI